MRYQEFIEHCQTVIGLSDEVAVKECEQRKEQGQSAIIGMVGFGVAGSDIVRDFWIEVRHRLEEGDKIGPCIYGDDNKAAVRGLAVWRSSQES